MSGVLSWVVPPVCSETGGDLACNRLTSALEVYTFCVDAPDHAFVYVDNECTRITTWMGDVLSRFVCRGKRYVSNMGDERQSIRFRGINGETYAGTFFRGAGSYARVRRVTS